MAKTVEEIARATGVSVTTVRFVIGGQAERHRISVQTRERVEGYIAEHGYVLNHTARALKLRRSESVGLVVPDLANPFFARVMARLEGLCGGCSHVLLAVASHEDPVLESRAVAALLARGVDGIVIAPSQPDLPDALRVAKRLTPVVFFDRDYGHPAYPTVLSDNTQGAGDLTRRVLAESPGDCVFFCGHAESPTIRLRIQAYADACSGAGRPELRGAVRVHPDDSPRAGGQLMSDYLKEVGRPPQALLCSSLLMLEGVLQALKQEAAGIPPGLVIGTFDDHTMLDLLPNRVFSVRQDEVALAEHAFAALGLDAPAATGQVLIPCRLVERNVTPA